MIFSWIFLPDPLVYSGRICKCYKGFLLVMSIFLSWFMPFCLPKAYNFPKYLIFVLCLCTRWLKYIIENRIIHVLKVLFQTSQFSTTICNCCIVIAISDTATFLVTSTIVLLSSCTKNVNGLIFQVDIWIFMCFFQFKYE